MGSGVHDELDKKRAPPIRKEPIPLVKLTPEEIQSVVETFLSSLKKEEESARLTEPRRQLRDKIIDSALAIKHFREKLNAAKNTTSVTELMLFCLEHFYRSGQLFGDFFHYHRSARADSIQENIESCASHLIQLTTHKENGFDAMDKATTRMGLIAQHFPEALSALSDQFTIAHKKAKKDHEHQDPTLYGLLSKYAVQLKRLLTIYSQTIAVAQPKTPEPCSVDKPAFGIYSLGSLLLQVSRFFSYPSPAPSTITTQTPTETEYPPVLETLTKAVLIHAEALEASANGAERMEAFYLLWRLMGREPIGQERREFYSLLAQYKIQQLEDRFYAHSRGFDTDSATEQCAIPAALLDGSSLPTPAQELQRLFPQSLDSANNSLLMG